MNPDQLVIYLVVWLSGMLTGLLLGCFVIPRTVDVYVQVRLKALGRGDNDGGIRRR